MLRTDRRILVCTVWFAITATASVAAHKSALQYSPNGTAFRGQTPFGPASLLKKTDRNAARPVVDYTFTDIAVPGAVSVYPWEINNAGDIAGFIDEADGGVATFYRVNGLMKVVRYSDDHPGTPYNVTSVSAINNAGDVLFGNWGTFTFQKAGYYVIATKQWIELPDIPGYRLNFGARLLDSGLAIGFACADGDYNLTWNCIGWLWNGTQYTRKFSFDGEASTIPYGMNSSGEFVGMHFDRNPDDPAYSLQTFTGGASPRFELDPLTPSYEGVEATQALATDISDNGVIVGRAEFAGMWYAYRYDRGLVMLLPDYPAQPSGPPVAVSGYFSVNARGELFGYWVNALTGQLNAFVAAPQPVRGR